MRCIIMANGEYGNLNLYTSLINSTDIILCADGGANYAMKMGVIPTCIIGDMDSISPEVKEYYIARNAVFKQFPRSKDFTDTQLVVTYAEELGAKEIIFLGTMGKRLDHTMSNLYSGIEASYRGIKIMHFAPGCMVYLVTCELELQGNPGDIVSVLALSEKVLGVCETGFEYPLQNAVLEYKNPYAISNVLISSHARISIEKGILAVFHYNRS